MRKNSSLGVVLSLVLAWLPLQASGQVSGEAILAWWANDFEADLGEGEIDAGSVGGHLDLWGGKWGGRAALYSSDLADAASADDVNYFSLDLKYRFVSPSKNNYFAGGIGWQRLDLIDGDDTNGVRLVLDGRVSLIGILYLYGQGAWLPWLDDTDLRTDLKGFEFEGGVSLQPLPLLSLRLGWRIFEVDSTGPAGGDRSDRSSGPVVAAGLHW